MMQITKAFIWILAVEQRYPIEVVTCYNDINKFLDKAEYLIVSTAGNILVDIGHLRKKIHNISNDVGLIGHLLKYKSDTTPWLHEQFFIINTTAIKSVDLTFESTNDTGLELIRSKEDLHGGWAPAEVTLGTNRVDRELKFGTKMIEDCLNSGYRVVNFDNDWRYPTSSSDYVSIDNQQMPSRGYCYPTMTTDIFEKSLKNLEIYPGLHEAQEMIITVLKKVLEFKVLNVWNNDTVPDNLKAEKIISTSNGFLGELLALSTGARNITFYDKNKHNLEFKEHLYKNWNGSDYESFATEWATKRGLSIEPVFEVDKIKCKKWIDIVEKNIFSYWEEWKKDISVEFIYVDIVESPQIILDKFTNNTVLHTSTILSIFPFTAFVHDEETIEQTRMLIKEKILDTNSNWIET